MPPIFQVTEGVRTRDQSPQQTRTRRSRSERASIHSIKVSRWVSVPLRPYSVGTCPFVWTPPVLLELICGLFRFSEWTVPLRPVRSILGFFSGKFAPLGALPAWPRPVHSGREHQPDPIHMLIPQTHQPATCGQKEYGSARTCSVTWLCSTSHRCRAWRSASLTGQSANSATCSGAHWMARQKLAKKASLSLTVSNRGVSGRARSTARLPAKGST